MEEREDVPLAEVPAPSSCNLLLGSSGNMCKGDAEVAAVAVGAAGRLGGEGVGRSWCW